jgi:uncharacterized protein YegL
MKKNLTELVFILDKSGSMEGMEADTIGGFNSMIASQRKEEGEAIVSTVLFSNYSTVLHDRKRLNEVKELTEKEYVVGGCTALLDAIGGAIRHIKNVHKYAREEDIPEHTMFVITTDGYENASREFSGEKVRSMIAEQEKNGWKFIFVAANIDAVEAGSAIGIDADSCANYDLKEARVMLCETSDMIKEYRRTGKVNKYWKKNIENKKSKDDQ